MHSNFERPLTETEIGEFAPSVFASAAASDVSNRYSFVPTVSVVRSLQKEGWSPVWVNEQRVRLDEYKGFQKHMIRFQRTEIIGKQQLQVGGVVPEVLLINSHNRSSAFQVHAGLFRLICSNGMVVADSTFSQLHVRHSGDPNEIVNAAYEILDSVPAMINEVTSMKEIQLEAYEQKAFAESALIVKYGEKIPDGLNAESALKIRRREDNSNDLWTTFNRVQENLVSGSMKSRYSKKVRATTGIDQSVNLNKGLWHLAEALKAVKAA